MKPISLCVPEISRNEWRYIKRSLDKNWVSTSGPEVDKFEREFADYLGIKYAVATVNGTAAIHTAMLVTGIKPNDEVLVSDLTFIAPANAVRYASAWPIFIDAEPKYWQIDPEKVADFINRECKWFNGELKNKRTGRSISAIIPVHILGHPVDLNPILRLADKYNLSVIEDATESLGALYRGNKVGTLGDLACFSFNGNKLLTTGGGGMIVTNNEKQAIRAKYLTTQAKDNPIESIHGTVGFNYRLPNILAAMGLAQLESIEKYLLKKRQIAEKYKLALLESEAIQCMSEAEYAESAFWLYTILLPTESRTIMNRLRKVDIETRPLWQPMHLSPAHSRCQSYHCDNAEMLYRRSLSLPSSVGLSVNDQNRVIETLLNSVI